VNLPRLMLVTDRARCAPRDLIEIVAAAVEGGVELVQLREKDLSARGLLALARRLRDVTRGRARLLINDRVEVTLLCEADGVHLSERGFAVTQAREVCRARTPDLLVGRSIHSLEAARKAERQGADYLIAGSIFTTASHPDTKPQGPDFLRDVCAAVTIPVFAIGGVTRTNARACLEAGAHGVAVIGEVMGANDPALAASNLLAEISA